MLAQFTQQGINNIKNTAKRAEKALGQIVAEIRIDFRSEIGSQNDAASGISARDWLRQTRGGASETIEIAGKLLIGMHSRRRVALLSQGFQ